MARDRPEAVGVRDPRQRSKRHDLAARRLRDLRERAEIGQRIDRLEAVVFADALERLQRDVAQHAHRFGADGFVAVVARDRRRAHPDP